MAADWVGVVGVGVGGVVSVSSLAFNYLTQKRRDQRDAANRARDRTWDITLQNIDQRREVYIRLSKLLAEYDETLEWLEARVLDSSDESLAEKRGDMADEIESLSSIHFEIDMSAQHQKVGEILGAIIDGSMDLHHTLEAQSWDNAPEAASILRGQVVELRNACRWDLGLFARDPYAGGPLEDLLHDGR